MERRQTVCRCGEGRAKFFGKSGDGFRIGIPEALRPWVMAGMVFLLPSCGSSPEESPLILEILEATVREKEALRASLEDLREENRQLREQNEVLMNLAQVPPAIIPFPEADSKAHTE